MNFKVRKRGKTRGRPSNMEINMGKVLNAFLERNKKAIEKFYLDTVLYGSGVLDLSKFK